VQQVFLPLLDLLFPVQQVFLPLLDLLFSCFSPLKKPFQKRVLPMLLHRTLAQCELERGRECGEGCVVV
jgi:hypothetical protein